MNGSHIIAVNVMLGARNAWPQSGCGQLREDSTNSESNTPASEPLPRPAPAPAKSAWSRVWQRVSCLLD
jgi:hypothetical protein